MFSFRTTPLLEQDDLVLRKGHVGLLCNQTSWNPETGEYLFETLSKRGVLKRVFTPEHGLFAELQDQVKLNDADIYKDIGCKGTEFVSLYGSTEQSLTADVSKLQDLDALIIELQDSGCRYFTYPVTVLNIFNALKDNELQLPVYIVDRADPAGRQVEGTALRAGYRSFIGIEGIPHRHGLTIGELSYYLYEKVGAKFPLHIISYKASAVNRYLMPWSIPPSPNFPGFFTASFYSGQCLWEGTNVSEGRGTTRPFEIFGAPYMESLASYNSKNGFENWNDLRNPISDRGAYLRWLKFIPTFSKYAGECCWGFQILLNPNIQYNSLLHSMRIMRFLKDNCNGFAFRPGKYEAGNDKSAIELLLGDKELVDYVNGEGDFEEVKEHIKVEEQKWIKKAKKFLLYENEPLFRIK